MSLLTSNQHVDRQVLLDIANAFTASLEVGTVVRVLVDVISRTLHPGRVVVYLCTDEHDKYVLVGSTHVEGMSTTSMRLYPPLQEYVQRTGEIIVADTLLNQPAPYDNIGQWLRSRNLEVAVPLIVGGELYGVVMLSPRQNGQPYSDDEIELLNLIGRQAAVAFGNAKHYTDLRRFNTALEQAIYERTQDLAGALDKLEEANRAKDEFLAVLSHELLTPLTCILAWTEIADREEQNPEMTRRSLQVIRENVDRQRHLINDLLDTSRVVHGKMELSTEPLDLWSVVVRCVESVCHQEIRERYQITTIAPAVKLPVSGDRMRLQQVITNLLNNAIKFTMPGGAITISGTAQHGKAIVSIADSGFGIPPEHLATIFSPFAQVKREQGNCGLGLGLALVHSIITLHGGAVNAESEGNGKGSRFTIALPLEG